MSILIKGLEPIIIVSKFGSRIRNGIEEFHPGVDIRVVDSKYVVYLIVAPEMVNITEVRFDPKWGHYIKAVPVNDNPLGVIEFRFWHIFPLNGICKEGACIEEGEIIGTPESGYVSLHLHFETRIDYRGTTPIDPTKYLSYRGSKFINKNDI